MPKSFRIVLAVAAFALATGFVKRHPASGEVTVHEWGTFTSIAGEDGRAIEWLPLDGPIDLPCFVERSYAVSPKGALFASVRMETPVLYFYAWRRVRILPGAAPEFQTESRPNHYYAARATDAAPVEVGTDRERFLFYRGVGNFALPIAATIVRGDDVLIRSQGTGIPAMMLFENRGGRIGHRIHHGPVRQVVLSRPEPADDEEAVDAVRAALQEILERQGLYPREARAMIETWRDSWFTEGARIFYVVPQETIDGVLPLSVDPVPARVVRVFVGRLELATDATLADIKAAALSSDMAGMRKYGRFLRPFADRLLARTAPPADREALAAKFEDVTSVFQPTVSVCR